MKYGIENSSRWPFTDGGTGGVTAREAASTTTGRLPRRRPRCRRGSCRRTNASASPTCIALGLVETGDRPQAGPRSVHDQPRYCAATPIPPPAPIGRSARTGVPSAAVRDHDRPSWSAMSSSTSCATASRTSRRGIWCPRPSIRRSTCKDAAGCAVNCTAPCAPAAPCADHAAAQPHQRVAATVLSQGHRPVGTHRRRSRRRRGRTQHTTPQNPQLDNAGRTPR